MKTVSIHDFLPESTTTTTVTTMAADNPVAVEVTPAEVSNQATTQAQDNQQNDTPDKASDVAESLPATKSRKQKA